MWDLIDSLFRYLFDGGNWVFVIVTLLMIYHFYMSHFTDENGNDRRRAKHCLYALIAVALYASADHRQDTRQACLRGDTIACSDLDI